MPNDRAHFFFPQNLTGFPLDEWIADCLKEIALACWNGEIIVFVGEHPCFNSLYDILNLRYKNDQGYNTAIISHYGQSFTIPINANFRFIVIIEEIEYQKLPAPFLNRFEKLYFDYDFQSTSDKLLLLLGQFSFPRTDYALFDPKFVQQYLAANIGFHSDIWPSGESASTSLISVNFLNFQPSSIFTHIFEQKKNSCFSYALSFFFRVCSNKIFRPSFNSILLN